MPYNYLIDEKIRENFEIDYANSVIIIDEAHNIAGCCEEVASKTINESILHQCINELDVLYLEAEN
jgi:regulator of telomere elongation helicase 1